MRYSVTIDVPDIDEGLDSNRYALGLSKLPDLLRRMSFSIAVAPRSA